MGSHRWIEKANQWFLMFLILLTSIALQGDAFPPDASPADLKRLIRMQKLGAERAEAALKAME